MKTHIVCLLGAVALVACATKPQPAPRDFFERVAGKRVYGMVAVTNDIPQETVLKSQACVKRDALCMVLLQQASQIQSATVSVYDTFAFLQVFVPKSAALKHGDIIQFDVPTDRKVAPSFVSIGARDSERGPQCDWVDGSVFLRTGGVSCAGWSYKSLL